MLDLACSQFDRQLEHSGQLAFRFVDDVLILGTDLNLADRLSHLVTQSWGGSVLPTIRPRRRSISARYLPLDLPIAESPFGPFLCHGSDTSSLLGVRSASRSAGRKEEK